MIRHSSAPIRFGLMLGLLALVALPPLAWGQDRSTDDRLDRLERDLNMLQRQVYRGGVPAESVNSGDAVGADIRMDRLEQQMRDLTGRVEEFSNQVAQLHQRIEQINSDLDVRFSQLQGTNPAMASAAPPGPPPAPASRAGAPPQRLATRQGDNGTLTPPTSLMPPGTAVPAPGAPPQAIFGTLSPTGSPPPPPLASAGSLRPPTPGAPPGVLPGGSPSEQYNYAFGLLKQADYPAAEDALRTFVQRHPDDAMAGNAQYWLGETFYARGKYAEAAGAFAEGYKRYPKGAKAADDLLKLGMALGRTNQKQNACLAFGQLERDFPSPGASVRERAAAEKRRLGC